VGHAGQYSRVISMLEDARAETIHKGHLEGHPCYTYVEHLERKK
jgi:hypothetical protein